MVGKLFGAVGKLTQGDMLGAMKKEIGDAMGSLSRSARERISMCSARNCPSACRASRRSAGSLEESGTSCRKASKPRFTPVGQLRAGLDPDPWGRGQHRRLDQGGLGLAQRRRPRQGSRAGPPGSSVAGAAQVSKPVTEALNFGIGMAQVAKSISDLKSTIDELKNSFAGI